MDQYPMRGLTHYASSNQNRRLCLVYSRTGLMSQSHKHHLSFLRLIQKVEGFHSYPGEVDKILLVYSTRFFLYLPSQNSIGSCNCFLHPFITVLWLDLGGALQKYAYVIKSKVIWVTGFIVLNNAQQYLSDPRVSPFSVSNIHLILLYCTHTYLTRNYRLCSRSRCRVWKIKQINLVSIL